MAASPTRPSSITYYMQNGFATANVNATDDSGGGFLANLPPGRVAVDLHRADTGDRIGTIPLFVGPDTVTVLVSTPTP